tara:strand:- start:127 stop:1410 length:1284 start_codon:yes stop_codon:yes gene_type:complete
MSELNILINQMKLDNQRRRLDQQQEQFETVQSNKMLNTLIQSNVRSINEISTGINDENDIEVLNNAINTMEQTKTGIDINDEFVDANILNVQNRINDIETKGKILTQLNDLKGRIGNESTTGANKILDDLGMTYSRISDSLNEENKTLVRNQINNTRNQLEVQGYLNVIDQDTEKEGMQFKDKTTQKLYNEVVDPYVKVASVTDDYVTALASLRSFFPALAQQKEDMLKAYAEGKEDALEAQEAKAIEARKKTLMGYKAQMNEVDSVLRGNMNPIFSGTSGMGKITYNELAANMPQFKDFAFGTDDSDLNVVAYAPTLNRIAYSLALISEGEEAEKIRDMGQDRANVDPLVMEDRVKTMIVRNTKETNGKQRYGKYNRSGNRTDNTPFVMIKLYNDIFNEYQNVVNETQNEGTQPVSKKGRLTGGFK